MSINNEKTSTDKPLVAIHCITYNHEQYIKTALEGFVMQQTNFPFVAIVHDDASTDGTAAIIREYAAKYPKIIKPIFETENQYSKRNGSVSRIMREAINATEAKYVAYCEGDDYWTDPLKLQKQVDFLEADPDYSMCFHNAIEHWENNSSPDLPRNDITDKDFTGIDIYNSYVVPTASIMVRISVVKNHKYLKAISSHKFIFGDLLICLSASDIGKIRYSKDVGSVYRRHNKGATFTSLPNPFVLPGCHRFIPKYFGLKYFVPVRNRIITVYRNLTLANIKSRNYRTALKALALALKYDPLYTVYSFAKYCVWKTEDLASAKNE